MTWNINLQLFLFIKNIQSKGPTNMVIIYSELMLKLKLKLTNNQEN